MEELDVKIAKVTAILSATSENVERNPERFPRQPGVDLWRWNYLMGLIHKRNELILQAAGGCPRLEQRFIASLL